MAILRMQKLRMIVPLDRSRKVLKAITGAGCIEVEKNDTWMADPELSRLVRKNRSSAANAHQLSEVSQALDNLSKYAKIKKGLLQPRTMVTEETFTEGAPEERTLQSVENINAAAKEISSLGSEKMRLAAQKLSVQPWLGVDIPIEYSGEKDFAFFFGTLPVSIEFNKAKETISKKSSLCEMDKVCADKDFTYVLLAVHREELSFVLEKLRDFAFSKVVLKSLTGTARQITQKIEKKEAEIEAELLKLKETIAEEGKNFGEIGKAYDYYYTQSQWDDIQSSLPATKSVCMLIGWMPEEAGKEIASIAEENGCACEFSEPADDEIPPTVLRNNRFVEPFGQVTALYGMPDYRSIVDPNPVVAFSYWIFFGMMFSDAVYGLILSAACFFFLKKARPDGGMKRFVTMFGLCGITTFVWGCIMGGWCGDFINVTVERITGQPFTMPYLLDPLQDPLLMLGLSLGMGVIHLFAGIALNIKREIARKEYINILCDELTWVAVIICALLIFLGCTWALYVAAACLVVIAISATRGRKGLGKFTGAFGALYNGLTGNLSDILSYSRLMALAMSTGVVAQVMNTLGNMGGTGFFGWIFFILVFIVGQVFNFAISILGAFVHSCRLQFVELFGRFYEGGGRDFRPLFYRTKYVEISKEGNVNV